MYHVDSAAKPLDAVVLVHVNLDVVDGCAASNRLKRDAVKLVFCYEEATSMLTRTCRPVPLWLSGALATAVFSGVTFTLSNATRLVEVKSDLPLMIRPRPLTANASVVIWGEDDGCVSGAFSFNLCSAGDAKKVSAAGVREYIDACFDFQCDVVSVVADEDGYFDKPSEVVCLGHGEVSGDRTGNLAETSAGNFSARYIWMVNRAGPASASVAGAISIVVGTWGSSRATSVSTASNGKSMKATVSVELSSFFIVFFLQQILVSGFEPCSSSILCSQDGL